MCTATSVVIEGSTFGQRLGHSRYGDSVDTPPVPPPGPSELVDLDVVQGHPENPPSRGVLADQDVDGFVQSRQHGADVPELGAVGVEDGRPLEVAHVQESEAREAPLGVHGTDPERSSVNVRSTTALAATDQGAL